MGFPFRYRHERHRDLNVVHTLELAHELLDLLGDLRADRAARRGQRKGDVDVSPGELDPVDEAELHEIESQLGIDHVAQRGLDIVDGQHRSSVDIHSRSLMPEARACACRV